MIPPPTEAELDHLSDEINDVDSVETGLLVIACWEAAGMAPRVAEAFRIALLERFEQEEPRDVLWH
jgi:hypothetical protein